MARENRTQLFQIAVSPARAADAIGVDPSVIEAAVRSGDLPLYQVTKRGARRIPVLSLTYWIESKRRVALDGTSFVFIGGSNGRQKKHPR